MVGIQSNKGGYVMKKQKKIGTAGLADFFRQFSVLVSSGLPIAGALEIMETDETDQRFSRACRLFKQRMTDGMAIGMPWRRQGLPGAGSPDDPVGGDRRSSRENDYEALGAL